MRLSETVKNVLRLFSGNALSFAINLGIGFLILHYLRPEEFGLYGIPSDLINMLVLGASALFTGTTQKFLSEYVGSGDYKRISGLIKFSLGYSFVVSLFLFLAFYFLSDTIAKHILHNTKFSWIIKVYSTYIPFMVMSSTFASILSGFGRFGKVSINDIFIPSAIRGAFLLLTLPAYENRLLVAILSNNVKYITNFISDLFAVVPEILRYVFKPEHKTELKKWVRYGFPLWLKYWLSMLQENVKPVLVGSIMGVFSGGMFKAASLLSNGIYILEISISNVLFVEVSRDMGSGNMHIAAGRIRRITLYITVLMAVISSLSSFAGTWVLKFFGKGYEQGGAIFAILILGYYLNSISGIWQAFIQGSGRSDYVLLINVFYSISEIGLILAFIKPFGVVGAALSLPVSAIMIGFLRFYLFLKVSRIKPIDGRTLKTSIILGILVFVCGYLANTFL